ncbi:MAG: VOC family protein [Boseongicola sp.]
MTFSLHHTAITTTDFPRLLAFYTDVLRGEIIREAKWDGGQTELDARIGLAESSARMALIKFGSAFFEIFEFMAPKVAEGGSPTLARTGLTHIALSCADCIAEYEQLSKAGMVFNAPPWKTPAGGIFTFGKDPDGNIIEILQPAPDSR